MGEDTRSILVVDNDVSVLQRVEKALKKNKYEVQVATDGALAVNRALAAPPDVVVSAVEMPLLDGFKLCQLLRTNPVSRDIPFVFLTTRDTIPQRLGKFLRPFDEFLLKPFKENDLLERINGLLIRLEKVEEVSAGGQALLGTLTEITLMDLLQIMRMNRRSGSLDLEQDSRIGTVFLREGEVVNARLGKFKGEKAFYRLLNWDKGKFEFHPKTIDTEVLITRPGENLILEGLRQIDEINRMKLGFPPGEGRLELVKRFQGPPERLRPVTRDVLKLLEYFSTIDDLLSQSSFNDMEICQTVQSLIERKIIAFRSSKGTETAGKVSPLISLEGALKLSYQLGVGKNEDLKAWTGKILIFSCERPILQQFLEGLSRTSEFKVEAGIVLDPRGETVPLGSVGSIRVLEGTELSMYSFPCDPSYKPLWEPLSQGAIGALILTEALDEARNAALFCDEGLGLPFIVCAPELTGKDEAASRWDWEPAVAWDAAPAGNGAEDAGRKVFSRLFELIMEK